MLHWLLHLIRMVLRRVTYKMESILSSGKPYGSSRSIVRKIGTNLSLIQSPRVHFQLIPDPLETNHKPQNGTVASFADVWWVANEQWDVHARVKLETRSNQNQVLEDELPYVEIPFHRQVSLPALVKEEVEMKPQSVANVEAMQKINALESELASLRAQIAKIITVQEQQHLTGASSPPTPVTVGIPLLAAALPPPPPPPPPPPLPPPPGLQRSVSAIDLIKERKGKKSNTEISLMENTPKKSDIPNMLDVLKDMNRVKLRSVKRSPEDAKAKPCDPADPATLIAEALKKKFAYRYRSDSFGEADKYIKEPEPKKTNGNPLFGPHTLKSTGKMKSLVETTNSWE
ncbi:mitochondrial fission regulator 1 [Pelodytes ibericus]